MFNFEDVGQSLERQSGVVPPGLYKAKLVDVDFKPTQKGGTFWKVTLQTDSGKVWMNYTHDNPSDVAQRIGREGFTDLLFAGQIPLQFESLEVLQAKAVNKELLIEVYNQDEGENAIKAYVGSAWRLDGSHRAGDKRKLDPIVLGPNGKKPIKSKKANTFKQPSSFEEGQELPF